MTDIVTNIAPLFEQAVDHLRRGRTADAAEGFRRVLPVAPDHVDSWRLLAMATLSGGDAERARRIVLRAVALNPASADSLHLLGGATRRIGDLVAACGAYRRAMVLRPDFTECAFNYGNALTQASRFEEAVAIYAVAVAGQPLHPSFRINHSGALARRGRFAEAAAQGAAALALEPVGVSALVAMARAESGRGDPAAAARHHRRAMIVEPGDGEHAYDLALALKDGGRIDEAVTILRGLADATSPTVRHGAEIGLYNISVQLSDAGEHERAVAVMACDDDGVMRLPSRVRIESSSACNLRCRHCTTGVAYTASDRRLMRMELFERVVGQLRDWDALISAVMYLGGEPLMNPHLARMIRGLRDGTPVRQIHFVTNAMLATEERCRELASSGVDKIIISIDGRSPEENDAIRRGSHYPTIRDNVRALRRHLEPAGVTLAISNNILRRPGDPDTPVTPEYLRRDFPRMPVITNYAYKWPGWTLGGGEDAMAVEVAPTRRKGFCSSPFTETTVRANGEVALCCYDISGIEVMGNVNDTPLAEIWNGERYRRLRRAMLAHDEAALPDVCRRCPVYTGEELHAPGEIVAQPELT